MIKDNKIAALINTAFQERWSEAQWGMNIKNVLLRGVSGDAYNVAECLLKQAVIGSTANPLILVYLKHSLHTHIVSYAAVIRAIAAHEQVNRTYCITSLLEFLEPIVKYVVCRNKAEEASLPGAVLSLACWLVQVISAVADHYDAHRELTKQHHKMLRQLGVVIEQFASNDYLLGLLYVARHEDPARFATLREFYACVRKLNQNSNFVLANFIPEAPLQKLTTIGVHELSITHVDEQRTDNISYCVQPLLAVDVLLNPGKDAACYVAELQLLQSIKRYSTARLYYEIMRAGFISLNDFSDNSHSTVWGAFTLCKIPVIIKELHAATKSVDEQTPRDYIPEMIEALDMLLEDSTLLDFLDTKCSCNFIEFLLKDWTKQTLVNDAHVQHFAALRENAAALLPKRDAKNQSPPITNVVAIAEVALSGFLKTLNVDYNKKQDVLLSMLGQVLSGSSFDLIVSVAMAQERIKLFVTRLIQCNENSKPVPGEQGKSLVTRSTIFDASFLMLTVIIQTYGTDAMLPEQGDSFFEQWARICMVEPRKPNGIRSLLALCDNAIVDELLVQLSKPDAQLKNCNLSWQDICLNIPGVLHKVLIGWEKESFSSADVKQILDNIKRRMFCYSVCATFFLCAFLSSARETELLKPLNMIQQLMTPASNEEQGAQEHANERMVLALRIMRKMQQDVHTSGNQKSWSMNPTLNVTARAELAEPLQEVWQQIMQFGWLPVKAAQTLKALQRSDGYALFVKLLLEQIYRCQYPGNMTRITDIICSLMHIDINQCTNVLLQDVVSTMLAERQGEDINEPQTLLLARICVYCIISAVQAKNNGASKLTTQRKRTRSQDDNELAQPAKMRKLAVSEGIENSSANEFISAAKMPESSGTCKLSEPLLGSIQRLFQICQHIVQTDAISPKVYFVYQFISLLVEYGGERVRPVLRLVPPNILSNLLKIIGPEAISEGLICQLYDMSTPAGRQVAVADMCLRKNMQLRRRDVLIRSCNAPPVSN